MTSHQTTPKREIPVFGSRSDADLTAFSDEHVSYEFQMLLALHSIAIEVNSPNAKWLIQNALIESLAVHCRNTIDFLFGTHANVPQSQPIRILPRPDDVFAEEYCSQGWRDEVLKCSNVAQIEILRTRAHFYVAHLSGRRLYGEDTNKQWSSKIIIEAISPAIHLFISNAKVSKASPKLIAQLNQFPKETTSPSN